MTKKSNVYTKGGDKGKTSLVSGTRCAKSDFRVDLYGELDELNSYIGIVISLLVEKDLFASETKLMQKVQSALFDLGSKLACEDSLWDKYKLPDIKDELISQVEESIDNMDSELEKLKHFVLPGGHLISAHAHIARTVCRRVERKLVKFGDMNNELPINSLVLLNRLSDYFFILARKTNKEFNIQEPKWIP